MDSRELSEKEALQMLDRHESQFWEVKSARTGGSGVTKIGCAFANSDGGTFLVGVEDPSEGEGLDRWIGFDSLEAGNFILQALTADPSHPIPYRIEWLTISARKEKGVVAAVSVEKSSNVHRDGQGNVFVRRGAASVRILENEIVALSLSKGAKSFEDQTLATYDLGDLEKEDELKLFLGSYSPATLPADFARNMRIVDRDSNDVTVAGAIVYADDPQAVIPRKCSIKVARYESNHEEPDRDHLLGTPTTIDGPARQQIDRAIEVVTALVQQVPILGPDGAFSTARYPPEALKEVIVNAVVHRDYSLSDDILISVFDDRIVVRSPGVLPGHMTLENLLSDRASRNPKIVRLLHMMPNPPNKDIGEGLNTVMSKMKEAKLSDPVFMVDGSSFVVTLGHTTLARPQEIVMQYLENHDEITNSKARELCGIRSENRMKDVFYDLRDAGKIQRHPERNGSRSSWILVPAGRLFNPDAPE